MAGGMLAALLVVGGVMIKLWHEQPTRVAAIEEALDRAGVGTAMDEASIASVVRGYWDTIDITLNNGQRITFRRSTGSKAGAERDLQYALERGRGRLSYRSAAENAGKVLPIIAGDLEGAVEATRKAASTPRQHHR